jgi:hypothetical protein
MSLENVERLIVEDVRERLADLRDKTPWAEWRMAVVSSLLKHPSWYRDFDSAGVVSVITGVEPLLRDAGIDMSQPERWRANIDPVILDSLRKVRDRLLFDLTDQTAPPTQYAEPLWQAYKLLEQGIEAMTKASGIEEPRGQWITGEADQS